MTQPRGLYEHLMQRMYPPSNTKFATIGVSGLGQIPKSQLFRTWPKNELEPHGNPAYEGTGYPAAGYGQARRTVVKGVSAKPSANIVANELNTKSDAYTRAQVSVLAGLGCHCSPVDRRFSANLRGLAQVSSDDRSTMQNIADAIVRGTVPESFIKRVVEKLLADEKSNAQAYAAVQALKRLKQPFAAAEKQQQEAWAETNTAKFYALLIPEFQQRLGFIAGKPLVTAPDYAYIKQAPGGGVFAKVAQVLQDATTGTAAKNLLAAGFMKDSSLKGLGFAWVPVGIAVALLVAAGLFAWLQSTAQARAASASAQQLTDAYTAGRISKSDYEAAMKEVRETAAVGGGGTTDIKDIVMYAAYGVGAVVVLNIISSLRSALPSR